MQFDPEKITFFGRTDARGKNVSFGIKAKDRQRHMYVIGKTGMGKSTLLENMAVQDIQNGEGMAFIDPHGSAAETLLNYIPEHRIKDVLYFAPADASHPVSFNIMEDVGPDKRHLVVSGLMSVFKKIWVDAWSARMEYILQNTILALLEYPGSTLVGVNRMLSDKAYRDLVVNNVKDPSVRSFWVDEFAKYNERYMQEAGDAIKNKIGQFTANPIIRNIIGQPKSSFDIREMMDDRKILIMNLSKGLIGETNANLLGSMLTTRIYLAAMSRANLPPEQMKKMPNFYFYVDEFQSFANATFANILSEARKYHLNLTIAHQYIEQMEEDVRSAVFGNVGTIVAFRVGPFDAEVLETIFTPQFLAADIVNLGFAQIYLTLMIDGIGSQPFSATTMPPIAPQAVTYKDVVIGESRKRYARPRADVEADIVKFHEPVVVPRPDRPPRAEDGPRTGARPPFRSGASSDRPPRDRAPLPRETRDGGGLREVLRDVNPESVPPQTPAPKAVVEAPVTAPAELPVTVGLAPIEVPEVPVVAHVSASLRVPEVSPRDQVPPPAAPSAPPSQIMERAEPERQSSTQPRDARPPREERTERPLRDERVRDDRPVREERPARDGRPQRDQFPRRPREDVPQREGGRAPESREPRKDRGEREERRRPDRQALAQVLPPQKSSADHLAELRSLLKKVVNEEEKTNAKMSTPREDAAPESLAPHGQRGRDTREGGEVASAQTRSVREGDEAKTERSQTPPSSHMRVDNSSPAPTSGVDAVVKSEREVPSPPSVPAPAPTQQKAVPQVRPQTPTNPAQAPQSFTVPPRRTSHFAPPPSVAPTKSPVTNEVTPAQAPASQPERPAVSLKDVERLMRITHHDKKPF